MSFWSRSCSAMRVRMPPQGHRCHAAVLEQDPGPEEKTELLGQLTVRRLVRSAASASHSEYASSGSSRG